MILNANKGKKHVYCGVAAGQGLRKAALAPGRDETRAINPLVRTYVFFFDPA